MSTSRNETPRSVVLHPADRPLANRGGGARTIPMVTPGCGSTQLLNGFTLLDPGAVIPMHFHNCEESVLIVEGDAIANIDGVEHRLTVGDTTWLAPNVPHYFRNASDTAPMRIFWTYASVEATRTLVGTGDTRPIAAEHAKDKLIQRQASPEARAEGA
jgi:quercetin dioxygenase-like cupin family protein